MQTASLIYMLLGAALTAITLALNSALFRRGGVSALEALYYATALAGLVIGWYFNLQYLAQYGAQAGWAHWTGLLFVNPASASGGQDLILANVVIFPVWTIVEARRAGMSAGWLYFPVSLLTSYAFALALFLALRERQRRVASGPVL
jgi:Terpene cyclase DEP1